MRDTQRPQRRYILWAGVPMSLWFIAITTISGCNLIREQPDRNCDVRTAYYPDDDGDGIGEPTAVYIGCEPPAGWVTEVGDSDTDTDTDTDDTDTDLFWHTGDTGWVYDTSGSDTGWVYDTGWDTGWWWDTGDTSWWDTGP